MNNKIKELKDLNLMDRFLFAEAIEDKETYEDILEIILGKEIILKELPHSEDEKRTSSMNRRIILDVYGIDVDDNVYNTEVQNRNTHNLPRRSRFHSAVLDSKMLPVGAVDFNTLKDVYIIMIMSFDLFGEGKYMYTFKMQCHEVPGFNLDDGVTRIFLNTKGTNPEEVSSELVELLQYFENTTNETAQSTSSDKIKKMQAKIDSIKRSDEIGVKYMNAWEERILEKQDAYNEGVEAGIEQGIEQGIVLSVLKMLDAKLSYDVIATVTGYDIEKIKSIESQKQP